MFQFKGANGLRPRIGFWLNDDQFLGVEAEGFGLEQVASEGTVASNASAAPPLFVVFQNLSNTNAALFCFAFGSVPRAEENVAVVMGCGADGDDGPSLVCRQ